MNSTYTTIYISMDGDVSIQQLTREKLEERLNEHYWGEDIKILKELPEGSDPMYWGAPFLLIIKGSIMVPVAVEKVTKLQVE